MNKNNSFKSNKFLIVILVIIAILLFINVLLYIKKNIYESFNNIYSESESESENESENEILNNSTSKINNINLGINFESGISNINSTGTINFKKPFLEPPIVFTQIIGSTSTILNVYSIQIFDVTTTGFNYSKNKAYNNIQTKPYSSDLVYITPKIEPSITEPFIWIAFR